jgi:Tol biopolymer transport system component
MGQVWRAHDSTLNRDVALKVLPDAFSNDPERLARFKREAHVLAALNHPNIGAIHGIEDRSGTIALVLELVEGRSLAELVAGGGADRHALRLDETVHIARQIAEALEAAHEQGIVHRDLKPANVKVRDDGTVKVLDFGLAKALETHATAASAVDASTSPAVQTSAGLILGTAAYMSPEQSRGKPVDRRADIWAFGAVLFEMLAGRRAFEGDEISDVLAAVLRSDVQWAALPEKTPPPLRRLLMRCLDRDVRQRLQSIGEARVVLERPLADADSDPAPSAARQARNWRERVAWTCAVMFGALAVGLAALLVWSLPAPTAGTTLWLSIPPPAQRFAATPAPSVSPDGTQIAFWAPDSAGAVKLWVRALNSQTAKLLPTLGAGFGLAPAWAPDSRSLAVFAGNKLQTVSLGGGSPLAIADAPQPRGATWNRDNVILFVPSAGAGAFRIPASGGTAAPIALERFQEAVRFPSFLPDGRHFFFVVRTDVERDMGTYIASIDSPGIKRLPDVTSSVVYANGQVFFGRDDSLFAQPFDVETLNTHGDPYRVADELGFNYGDPANRAFSVSEHGTLATSNSPFLRSSRLTWFDRSGRTIGNLGEVDTFWGFTASRDLATVVLERFSGSGIDLLLLDPSRGTSSLLQRSASLPIFNARQDRVIFRAAFGRSFSIRELASNRVDPVPTTSFSGSLFLTDWSPDGTVCLVNVVDPKTDGDLWVLSLDGQGRATPYLQTGARERDGNFSPDGRWVAYRSNETGRDEVYVQSFPHAGAKRRISTDGGTRPTWRPDGRELFFVGPTRELMAVPVSSTAANFVAGPPQELFKTPPLGLDTASRQFAVSPDGQRFLMNVLQPELQPTVVVALNRPANGTF